MNRAAFVLGALLGVLGQITTTHAEQLLVSTAEPLRSDPLIAPPPLRGASMAEVKQRFGRPDRVFPAVGKPPITRWVYPEFVVYFERDWVIHSVEADTDLSGKTPLQNTARNP
ncbi:hypothetical protein [Nitrococcus mobilis]|uniref:hypothetical protein n=1 Tax=Nitrococcus mobilis TaxID=35797 RepID=UPI0002F2297C|nr:hypothetical protein [Nitrococcus mobilis]